MPSAAMKPIATENTVASTATSTLLASAEIQLGSWPVPPLFRLVRELAVGLDAHELHRTLNMGIGMVVVVAANDVELVQAQNDEPTWVIGRLTTGSIGDRSVRLLPA